MLTISQTQACAARPPRRQRTPGADTALPKPDSVRDSVIHISILDPPDSALVASSGAGWATDKMKENLVLAVADSWRTEPFDQGRISTMKLQRGGTVVAKQRASARGRNPALPRPVRSGGQAVEAIERFVEHAGAARAEHPYYAGCSLPETLAVRPASSAQRDGHVVEDQAQGCDVARVRRGRSVTASASRCRRRLLLLPGALRVLRTAAASAAAHAASLQLSTAAATPAERPRYCACSCIAAWPWEAPKVTPLPPGSPSRKEPGMEPKGTTDNTSQDPHLRWSERAEVQAGAVHVARPQKVGERCCGVGWRASTSGHHRR
jgi:hypothetical protein